MRISPAGILAMVLLPSSTCPAQADLVSVAGFRDDTIVTPSSSPQEFCPGTVLQQHDDGHFENGYAVHGQGVISPDWGAWAECYDAEYVCGIEFLLTRSVGLPPATMDVYVWQDDGQAPPGNNPGAVLFLAAGVDPGEIAIWPSISTHQVQVCCPTAGAHFVGFWGNWPGDIESWFIAADLNGPAGCPRLKWYPTGWEDPSIEFGPTRSLGIREYSGMGDCPPTPAKSPSWSSIKALFR